MLNSCFQISLHLCDWINDLSGDYPSATCADFKNNSIEACQAQIDRVDVTT